MVLVSPHSCHLVLWLVLAAVDSWLAMMVRKEGLLVEMKTSGKDVYQGPQHREDVAGWGLSMTLN